MTRKELTQDVSQPSALYRCPVFRLIDLRPGCARGAGLAHSGECAGPRPRYAGTSGQSQQRVGSPRSRECVAELALPAVVSFFDPGSK
jgi:hypothetical protein